MTKHDPVRRYLAELERALQGADPALIHDALIDAETHLEDAIFSGVPSGDAIRDFGSPEEIAAAYVAAETAREKPPALPTGDNAAPAARPWSAIPFFGIWFDRHAWRSYGLLTIGAGFSVAAAFWLYGLGICALGTTPLLIGLLLLVVLLGSARALSLFFGRLVECSTGVRMPHRQQPVDLAGAKGFFRRLLCWLKDVRSWLSLAFLLGNVWLAVPVAIAFFALGAIGVSAVLSGLVSGSHIVILNGYDHAAFGGFLDTFPGHVTALFGGLLLLTATLWLAKHVGVFYAIVVKAIQIVRPGPSAM